MQSRLLTTALTALILFSSATKVFAWGRDGHQLVAMIAELRLTPQAKAGVAALLGSKSLPDVANWADEVRKQRSETGPWHYVDIPFEFKTYDASRDGQNGNNVIDKINDFATELLDHSTPKDKQTEDLKFLIHFIGDIHQPMHCVDRNGDKGGNFRLLWFPGQDAKATNLHKIWDTDIVDAAKGSLSLEDFAKKLNGDVKDKDASVWIESTPLQWANDSHRLADEVAYNGIPSDGPPPKISNEYLQTAEQVVDMQLEKAGVRLANTLNRIFK